MKTVFLLFVVFTGNAGHQEMVQASDMQFSNPRDCKAELEHYENTKNMYFFCGDAELYFNKQQVFY